MFIPYQSGFWKVENYQIMIRQKRLDLFHAIRYSFASKILSDKQFCLGASNRPAEENTLSHSADVAGIKCTSRAHFINSGYSFLCCNHHWRGGRVDKIKCRGLVQYCVYLSLVITSNLTSLSGVRNWSKISRETCLEGGDWGISGKILPYCITHVSCNVSL